VHYPTDSSLLQDGVRVLTRTLRRDSTALGDARDRVGNRQRSAGRRVFEVGPRARWLEARAAPVHSCRKLVATTSAVMREANTMVRRFP
jgi:IS5 family transposase